MKNRIFTVSEFLLPYMIMVLERDDIPFNVLKDGNDGKQQVEVPLSGNQFHVVVEDARCEVQREKSETGIPVYSYRTLTNPAKRKRLMALNQSRGCQILNGDEEKTLTAFGCGYLYKNVSIHTLL